jgi:SulP family sulfate permease
MLFDRAGDLVEVNLSEDPQYHIATDRIQKADGSLV